MKEKEYDICFTCKDMFNNVRNLSVVAYFKHEMFCVVNVSSIFTSYSSVYKSWVKAQTIKKNIYTHYIEARVQEYSGSVSIRWHTREKGSCRNEEFNPQQIKRLNWSLYCTAIRTFLHWRLPCLSHNTATPVTYGYITKKQSDWTEYVDKRQTACSSAPHWRKWVKVFFSGRSWDEILSCVSLFEWVQI